MVGFTVSTWRSSFLPLLWLSGLFCITFVRQSQAQTIFVTPNQPWVDTGISISAGDSLTITATGEMDWDTDNTCPSGQSCTVGPNGQNPGVACPVAAVLAPQFACYSLIGRIGGAGSPAFEVGSNFDNSEVAASGELYLSVNDGYFADNTLGWTATITVGKNCSSMWNVSPPESAEWDRVADPVLTWDVFREPAFYGRPYLWVFAGTHVYTSPSGVKWGFVLNAFKAITRKPDATAAEAGQVYYIRNLSDWSGTATYGDGAEEYAAALAPGTVDLKTQALLDAFRVGRYFTLSRVLGSFDSPTIHVPLFDEDDRPLTKISYSKSFKTYMACSTDRRHFHTVAIQPWHVLYYGSVDVQDFLGDFTGTQFVQNSGDAVYYDEVQIAQPLPPPVTTPPIANCVTGYTDFSPSGAYVGNRCP